MDKTFPKVSVIIPVYNAEKYLSVCLESILIQTLTDFEVILVDDCSTDNSLAIAESYLERFGGRLKILTLDENTGSGAVPRNVGLEFSRGKYICFIDDDDFIIDIALETLYDFAENYQTDMVCMEKAFSCDEEPVPTKPLNEIGLIPPHFFTKEPLLEAGELTSERLEKFLRLSFGFPPWTKFLRRDFLLENKICLPEMKVGDDLIWTFELICRAKRILRVPNILYVYRTNSQSVMQKKRSPEQELRHWTNPLIIGIDYLNDFMNGLEIFSRADNLRLYVLNFFAKIQFDFMATAFKNLERHEAYKIFIEEFSESKGDHTALISYLLLMTNLYRNELSK
ncbi:MAG: glycosyltransferase [Selenomonadaceae bacterium]|nr:glycosyltransferase [Selenomonadaceae bacterium]